MKKKILKIGHRGAKGHLTENTMASIEKAIDLGVDGIELDVHVCASGEVVVFHDFTIDRLTNGTGEVSTFSLSALKKMTLMGGYQIPTLVEVLNRIKNTCIVNIELKGKQTTVGVSKIINDYVGKHGWKYQDFIVSSFQHELLQEVFEINKKIPLGVITEVPIEAALDFAKTIQAKSIHPDYTLLTRQTVNCIKKEGYEIYPWTVNDIKAIKRMQTYQVHGIITDYPDRL